MDEKTLRTIIEEVVKEFAAAGDAQGTGAGSATAMATAPSADRGIR